MVLTRTNWPDIDDLVALNADVEAMPGADPHLPISAARVLAEEMPRLMAHNRRADRLGSWVARDRETGSFLGWFMLTPLDEPVRTVELTHRLRPRAWGHGYDVEGVLGMVEIAHAAGASTVTGVDDASRRLLDEVAPRLASSLASGPAGRI
jgi:RimJ/RimL family protein N-acetyltransferase